MSTDPDLVVAVVDVLEALIDASALHHVPVDVLERLCTAIGTEQLPGEVVDIIDELLTAER